MKPPIFLASELGPGRGPVSKTFLTPGVTKKGGSNLYRAIAMTRAEIHTCDQNGFGNSSWLLDKLAGHGQFTWDAVELLREASKQIDALTQAASLVARTERFDAFAKAYPEWDALRLPLAELFAGHLLRAAEKLERQQAGFSSDENE